MLPEKGTTVSDSEADRPTDIQTDVATTEVKIPMRFLSEKN